MAVTLSDMRTLVRQITDLPARSDAGGFITDAELNNYINNGLARLHSLLVSLFEDYERTTYDFDITSGTTADLPLLFLKIRGLDVLTGSVYTRVSKMPFHERDAYVNDLAIWPALQRRSYAIYGSTIEIFPVESGVGTYRLYYTPQWINLTADPNPIPDFMTAQNWHQFAVLRAAIDCARKEESSTAELRADLLALESEIRAVASNRDAGEPSRVSEIR